MTENATRPRAAAPLPPSRYLDEVRALKFGRSSGSVRVDVDFDAGTTSLVFVDGEGREVGREPFTLADLAILDRGEDGQ